MSAQQETRIGIVGNGFVGGSHYQLFKQIADVYRFDKAPERSDVPNVESLVEKVGPEGVVIVAVNTPMAPDGSCDTSQVESVVRDVDRAAQLAGFDAVVCIKSTCVPGTTKKLDDELDFGHVLFSPEFLTEQNAVADLLASKRVVIGGRNAAAIERVAALYRAALPNAEILRTDPTTAEMVKYMTNCFLAMKVALANEFCCICKRSGIDYIEAIEIAQYDPRLGRSHWAVPGPSDHRRGFGGHCLPKDLRGLTVLASRLGCPVNVLRGAWRTNLAVRPPDDRDWEHMVGRAVQAHSPADAGCLGG